VSDEWDRAAASFDDEPDHGLRDPGVREAWARLLKPVLPDPPAKIADLGCGTGSLSVLLASAGHEVHGLDLSKRMLAHAVRKAAQAAVAATFRQGDAARPALEPGEFDVVLARHVLWALPDPAAALTNWIALLRPGGRLVLIEGRWTTGAGLTAAECTTLVEGRGRAADVRLLDDDALWGKRITDERYLLVSR
jgi:2-polyprenyl-3-methyl-5-hydroxy-6-metoxy-1,4-benzoquinol methylase